MINGQPLWLSNHVPKRGTGVTSVNEEWNADIAPAATKDGMEPLDVGSQEEVDATSEAVVVSDESKIERPGLLGELKKTNHPPRYSEAGFIKELEENGIGRPSTYASIAQVP